MGTKAEGDRMRRILIEYRDGKAVASEDREILDTMHRAALIPGVWSADRGSVRAEPEQTPCSPTSYLDDRNDDGRVRHTHSHSSWTYGHGDVPSCNHSSSMKY